MSLSGSQHRRIEPPTSGREHFVDHEPLQAIVMCLSELVTSDVEGAVKYAEDFHVA